MFRMVPSFIFLILAWVQPIFWPNHVQNSGFLGRSGLEERLMYYRAVQNLVVPSSKFGIFGIDSILLTHLLLLVFSKQTQK